MRFYESVFIARQDISTGQVDALCDTFADIVTSGGGKILKKEYWGLKSLAYRIRKNRKGHYVLFNMEADAATMDEYDRKLGLNEDIVRVLTLRIDEVDEEPSVIMQAKSDHSSREERGGNYKPDYAPREERAPREESATRKESAPREESTPREEGGDDNDATASEKGE